MSTLEYHKKYSHAKFPCDRCEFSGSSEGQLARHAEDVHAEIAGRPKKKRHASDIEIIDDSDSTEQSDNAEREEEGEGQRVNQGKSRNSY